MVGIDYIDSYLVTKNPHYLEKAKQVLTFILSGWDENFEGAVSWLEGVKDQKPACSNGKAMVLAYERIVCGLAPLSADKYEEKKVPIYFANGNSVCCFIIIA